MVSCCSPDDLLSPAGPLVFSGWSALVLPVISLWSHGRLLHGLFGGLLLAVVVVVVVLVAPVVRKKPRWGFSCSCLRVYCAATSERMLQLTAVAAVRQRAGSLFRLAPGLGFRLKAIGVSHNFKVYQAC